MNEEIRKDNSQLELVIDHLETEYENWRRKLSEHQTWLEMYKDSNSDHIEVMEEMIQNLLDERDFAFGAKKQLLELEQKDIQEKDRK